MFYESFTAALDELPGTDRLAVYDAAFHYQFYGEEPVLEGVQSTVWKLIKPQLDANNRRFANGLTGGRPAKKTTGSETEKPNKNKNDNNNKNNNNNNNNNKGTRRTAPQGGYPYSVKSKEELEAKQAAALEDMERLAGS